MEALEGRVNEIFLGASYPAKSLLGIAKALLLGQAPCARFERTWQLADVELTSSTL